MQLPGKCVNYVVTGCLTSKECVIRTVKTDVRSAKHLFSTENDFQVEGPATWQVVTWTDAG